MKKKLLLICFTLIITSSLITGTLSTNIIQNNYKENLFTTGVSNGNLIKKFLKNNPGINKYFFKISQQLSNLIDSRITFIDINGKPLADSFDNSIIFKNFNDNIHFNIAKNGKNNYQITKSSEKRYETMEIFLSPIEINSKNIIIMISSEMSMFKEYKKNIFIAISLSILISGFLSFILSFLFLRRFINPINKLTKASEEMSNGNFSSNLIIQSHDEVEKLAKSFNKMNFKINELLTEINNKANDLQSIIDNIMQEIFVINKNGDIILINKFAKNEFYIENNIDNIYKSKKLKNFIKYISISLNENKNIKMEIEDNSKIYLLSTNFIENKIDQIIIIIEDISKIKKVEELRKNFISNASHELKTPLTIISGFIETIKLGHFKDTSQILYFIDIIDKEVVRFKALVEKILSLSRLENSLEEKASINRINTNLVFNEIVESFKISAAKKNIVIKSNFNSDIILGYFSHEWFRIIIGNLIDNAIKFNKNNGEITLSSYISENNLILKIKDTGIGMDNQILENIFIKFYRGDSSRNSKISGTGLGLSIVKTMLDNINGKIYVSSNLGQGSTFKLTIPFISKNN
ncbi:MAG: ATP-binding protein [Fusobacterium sp. JB021]|nr:ATP-binding protein [Fusobacterium sp. JB020]MDP0493924.1 ATP-binding protein [Fusobacterium sp. JB021]MDP0506209.1 ATP-binding protein [Fusobacterium sp. JB019]